MNLALVSFGEKGSDAILAGIMIAGVALAFAVTLFLLGRHGHRRRKEKKHAKGR